MWQGYVLKWHTALLPLPVPLSVHGKLVMFSVLYRLEMAFITLVVLGHRIN